VRPQRLADAQLRLPPHAFVHDISLRLRVARRTTSTSAAWPDAASHAAPQPRHQASCAAPGTATLHKQHVNTMNERLWRDKGLMADATGRHRSRYAPRGVSPSHRGARLNPVGSHPNLQADAVPDAGQITCCRRGTSWPGCRNAVCANRASLPPRILLRSVRGRIPGRQDQRPSARPAHHRRPHLQGPARRAAGHRRRRAARPVPSAHRGPPAGYAGIRRDRPRAAGRGLSCWGFPRCRPPPASWS
jgi:hypothetical protein